MKLTEKDLEQLPKETADAVRRGDAVALEIRNPSMSNMFFTIVAALFVAIMFFPMIMPVSTFMFVAVTISALGWAFLYKRATNEIAMLQTKMDFERVVVDFMIKAHKKQEIIDEGTSDDETCLTPSTDDEKE